MTEPPKWKPVKRIGADIEFPVLYETEGEEDVADEGWAFQFDEEYHGDIVRSETQGRGDIAPKREPAWAARGGRAERLLLTLGVQPIRREMRDSLSRACFDIFRDQRCDRRLRALVVEYLLGPE